MTIMGIYLYLYPGMYMTKAVSTAGLCDTWKGTYFRIDKYGDLLINVVMNYNYIYII